MHFENFVDRIVVTEGAHVGLLPYQICGGPSYFKKMCGVCRTLSGASFPRVVETRSDWAVQVSPRKVIVAKPGVKLPTKRVVDVIENA